MAPGTETNKTRPLSVTDTIAVFESCGGASSTRAISGEHKAMAPVTPAENDTKAMQGRSKTSTPSPTTTGITETKDNDSLSTPSPEDEKLRDTQTPRDASTSASISSGSSTYDDATESSQKDGIGPVGKSNRANTASHHGLDSGASPPDRRITTPGGDVEANGVHMKDWSPTTHELLIMVVLSTISLMVALDACIIVTSLSAIVIDLKGNTTQGFWVGTSYLLTNAVTMPFIAAISDIFGRPILLLSSLAFFSLGTILCCLAQNMGLLLVGRSLQGVGGGGIIVLSLVIFTDIVPLRHRPKWYGTVLGAWALGNCLGPIIGGLIAEHTTWRWIFYIMFPFCAFGLISIPFLLTLKPRTATVGQKLARVDWVGSAIFMSSATGFLIAISWGGSQYSWGSAATLIPLMLGVAGLVITFYYEAHVAKEPFLRRSLFWSVSSVATYFCGGVQGLVLFGQLYYGPFYFLAVKGFSPVHTGIALFPVMFTLVPGSIVTGALVTRINNYRWAIWVGWALASIASGLMILFDGNTPTVQWVFSLIILGFGQGAILNAQNFATQAMCKPGEEGAAAAMYGFVRQFGTALGVGIGGSAFQNVMAMKLRWDGLPTAIAFNSEAYVAMLALMSSDSPERAQVMDAYVYGFRGVFGVYVAVSGIAFFVSLLIKHFDMNKDIATEHKLHENRVSRMFQPTSTASTMKVPEDEEARSPSQASNAASTEKPPRFS